MKLFSYYLSAISLLTFAGSALGQTDEQPKLPDQYAQVVLRVEGMT
jgi:hypothetical protein